MGNIQGNESKPPKSGKVKNLMKLRGKREGKDDAHFTGIVPNDAEAENKAQNKREEKEIVENQPEETNKNILVTDSWCKVNKNLNVASPGGDSSSDSVFTDAQTPVGFSTELNSCYYSDEHVNFDVDVPDLTGENYIGCLTLNNFKLNEYRLRREQDLNRKLNKLGVSKMSQISLNDDPSEDFNSENVEIVVKEDGGNVSSESGVGSSDTKNSCEKARVEKDFLENFSPASSKLFCLIFILLKLLMSIQFKIFSKLFKLPQFIHNLIM